MEKIIRRGKWRIGIVLLENEYHILGNLASGPVVPPRSMTEDTGDIASFFG